LIIDFAYFMRRIGEPEEQAKDRHFAYTLGNWHYKHEWNEAQKEEDRQRLDAIERSWRMLDCL
jgi:hypothetical protein